MEENKLFIINPPKLVGKFNKKQPQKHASTKLPKSIQNAVKEKLNEKLREFDALNGV